MKMIIRRNTIAIIVFILNFLPFKNIFAQSESPSDAAGDFLRQSDKLYVVISVLLTIFVGIIIFLIYQERKISRLEKKIKDKLHE